MDTVVLNRHFELIKLVAVFTFHITIVVIKYLIEIILKLSILNEALKL